MKLRSQIALKQEEVLKDKERQLEKLDAEKKDLQTKHEASTKQVTNSCL